MGYGEGKEEKLVAHEKMTNMERGTLHGVITYEGCMPLKVERSHNDEYVHFKSVEFDDPLIKKIEEVVGKLYNIAHRVSTPCICRVVGEYNKYILGR